MDRLNRGRGVCGYSEIDENRLHSTLPKLLPDDTALLCLHTMHSMLILSKEDVVERFKQYFQKICSERNISNKNGNGFDYTVEGVMFAEMIIFFAELSYFDVIDDFFKYPPIIHSIERCAPHILCAIKGPIYVHCLKSFELCSIVCHSNTDSCSNICPIICPNIYPSIYPNSESFWSVENCIDMMWCIDMRNNKFDEEIGQGTCQDSPEDESLGIFRMILMRCPKTSQIDELWKCLSTHIRNTPDIVKREKLARMYDECGVVWGVGDACMFSPNGKQYAENMCREISIWYSPTIVEKVMSLYPPIGANVVFFAESVEKFKTHYKGVLCDLDEWCENIVSRYSNTSLTKILQMIKSENDEWNMVKRCCSS